MRSALTAVVAALGLFGLAVPSALADDAPVWRTNEYFKAAAEGDTYTKLNGDWVLNAPQVNAGVFVVDSTQSVFAVETLGQTEDNHSVKVECNLTISDYYYAEDLETDVPNAIAGISLVTNEEAASSVSWAALVGGNSWVKLSGAATDLATYDIRAELDYSDAAAPKAQYSVKKAGGDWQTLTDGDSTWLAAKPNAESVSNVVFSGKADVAGFVAKLSTENSVSVDGVEYETLADAIDNSEGGTKPIYLYRDVEIGLNELGYNPGNTYTIINPNNKALTITPHQWTVGDGTYVTAKYENNKLVVSEEMDLVAAIGDGYAEEDPAFATLQAAANAAEDGDTITVLEDVDTIKFSDTLMITNAVTLNLNDKTIEKVEGTGNWAIKFLKNLVIQNGTINAIKHGLSNDAEGQEAGLSLYSVKLTADGCAVQLSNQGYTSVNGPGALYIDDCTEIESTSSEYCGILCGNGDRDNARTVTINGYVETVCRALQLSGNNEATIGEFATLLTTGDDDIAVYYGGTWYANGNGNPGTRPTLTHNGHITLNGNTEGTPALYTDPGDKIGVNLTMNTDNANISADGTGAAVELNVDGTITITDGEFSGSIVSTTVKNFITGGDFYYVQPTADVIANGYTTTLVDPDLPMWRVIKQPGVAVILAGGATTNYVDTIAEAIATEGVEQILLLKDFDISEPLAVNKSPLKFNLNGHTVNYTAETGWAFRFGDSAAVVSEIKNGTITSASYGVRVNQSRVFLTDVEVTATNRAAQVTGACIFMVDADSVLETTGNDPTLMVLSDGAATAPTVMINGTVKNTCAAMSDVNYTFAICGNGNDTVGMNLTIADGATVTAPAWSPAIYFPCAGSLTINQATITGSEGVYVKAGATTVVNGATINGIGEKGTYVANGGGTSILGDAFVVDNMGYPAGEPTVSITGGTFNSTNGKSIGSYGTNPITKFVSGGSFNTAIDDDVIADGRYLVAGASGYAVQDATGLAAAVGKRGYATFADAYAAAEAGETVTLLQNLELTDTLAIDKAITFDLGNKVVTLPNAFKDGIKLTAAATIQNGTLQSQLATFGNAGYALHSYKTDAVYSNLVVNAANYRFAVYAEGADTVAACYGENEPTTTVDCYNVDVKGNTTLFEVEFTYMNLDADCSAIAEGTAAGSYKAAIYSAGNATVTIAGGNYTHEKSLLSGNLGGKIVVNGGTFNGTIYSWMQVNAHSEYNDDPKYKAYFTLNAGTFTDASFDFKENTAAARKLDVITKGEEVAIAEPTGYAWENNVLVKTLPGDGTEDNPYQIVSADDLLLVKTGPASAGVYYELLDSIALSGEWKGIGAFDAKDNLGNPEVYTNAAFQGVFNGGGNTISGLILQRGDYVGFFGSTYNAGIYGLKIELGNETGFGAAENGTAGSAGGADYGGGVIVGVSVNTTIEDCETIAGTHGNFVATKGLGGIVGFAAGGTVLKDCVNNVNVATANEKAGGLIACVQNNDKYAQTGITIDTCTNNGNIECTTSGKTRVGGLASYADSVITFKGANSVTGTLTQNGGEGYSLASPNSGSVVVADGASFTVPAAYKTVYGTKGVDGLFFATVDGDTATLVKNDDVVASGTYKVMADNAPAITLADLGDTITIDTSLATVTVETSAEACEVTKSGNVYTVTAKSYTVTFDSGVASQVYTYDPDNETPLSKPADPGTGATFAGWTNDWFTVAITNLPAGTYGDISLYAKWDLVVAPGEKWVEPKGDTPAEVKDALVQSGLEGEITNTVTSAAEYTELETYVKDQKGSTAVPNDLTDNEKANLNVTFNLGADLCDEEITAEDVKAASITVDDGTMAIAVTIEGVTPGDSVTADKIEKVLTAKGGDAPTGLDESNVSVAGVGAASGKVNITVTPDATKFTSPKKFFTQVILKK